MKHRYPQPCPEDDPTRMSWGAAWVPYGSRGGNLAVLGAIASGKSCIFSRFLRRELPRLAERCSRAVIYDCKGDAHPGLAWLRKEGLLPSAVKPLMPFDARSCAWDLCRDITNPLQASTLAAALIPEPAHQSGNDGFFLAATRDILTAVVLTFSNCAPGEWEFRDLLLACTDPQALDAVLAVDRTREGRPFSLNSRVRRSYLGGSDPRLAANILATLCSHLSLYEPVAACWARAAREANPRRFSIREFANSSDILVLGGSETAATQMQHLNALLLNLLAQDLLVRPDLSPEERATGMNCTFFILDEFADLGRVESIPRLALKGRSRGAVLAIGAHSLESLTDVYGREAALSLLGQCGTMAILQQNTGESAQWAADLFGSTRLPSPVENQAIGPMPMITSGTQIQEARLVSTASLLYLPQAGPETGVLPGFYRVANQTPAIPQNPGIGDQSAQFRADLRWQEDLEPSMLGRDPNTPGIVLRPDSDLYLDPWDAADWKRLGLQGPAEERWVLGQGKAGAPA